MTSAVQAVFDAATDLSLGEKLELVQAIIGVIHRQYAQPMATNGWISLADVGIPASVTRTPPATDLALLAADFWPEDETADDINAFIARQRAEDLMREQ